MRQLSRVALYKAAHNGDVETFENFFAQQAALEAALLVEQGITDDAFSRLDSRRVHEPTLVLSGTWAYPFGGGAPHVFRAAVWNGQYELLEWFFTSPISALLRRTLQFFLLDIAKDAVRNDLHLLELLLASDAWLQYPECARSTCLGALVQVGVETRQPLVLNLLAAHGADFDRLLDCHDSLTNAAKKDPTCAVVNVLRDHGALRIGDDRALYRATMYVEGESILRFLELGVDPREARGVSLLHTAAGMGHHAAVAALLASVCVDLDAQVFGNTALHKVVDGIRVATHDGGTSAFASRQRQKLLKVIDLLLQHGADPNLCSSRELDCAPLHLAVKIACVETVRTLLKWGADPNVRSNPWRQQTPAHVLAEDGEFSLARLEVLELLVEHGADLTLKDANGVAPLQSLRPSPIAELARNVIQSAVHATGGPTEQSAKRHKRSDQDR